MMKCSLSLCLSLLLGLTLAASALAQAKAPSNDLERRVIRLERLIENRILEDMLTRLEDIQRDLTELRGGQEVHGHRIERLMDRQRQLYRDVDRRLVALERAGTAPAASVTPEPAAAPPPESSETGTVPASVARTETAPTPADAAAEQVAYERAFNLLTEGRYEQAQEEFRAFLAQYPDGAHAGNAQYWLAESHYLSRDFDPALAQFQQVLDRYPDSPKAPKAKLKIGFVYFELGDWETARKALEAVARQHPNSASARLAQQRLSELRQENRNR